MLERLWKRSNIIRMVLYKRLWYSWKKCTSFNAEWGELCQLSEPAFYSNKFPLRGQCITQFPFYNNSKQCDVVKPCVPFVGIFWTCTLCYVYSLKDYTYVPMKSSFADCICTSLWWRMLQLFEKFLAFSCLKFARSVKCCVVFVLGFNEWDDFRSKAWEKGLVGLLLFLRVLFYCCLDIFLLLVAFINVGLKTLHDDGHSW